MKGYINNKLGEIQIGPDAVSYTHLVDLYGKKSLPELLKRLCRISGLQWIRIQYCYPEEITDCLLYTSRCV